MLTHDCLYFKCTLLSWVTDISRHTGDFQAQDIVQDLNRLLDLGPDRNASMLRELFTAF